jgi:uncharacterized protein
MAGARPRGEPLSTNVTMQDSDPYLRARELLDRERFSEAFEIYSELAKSGDSRCQVFLGWMYQRGVGTRQDIAKALECYSNAATLGSKEGAFYLGRHLIDQCQYAEGKLWLEKSAAQEYGPALWRLGKIYLEGLGDGVDFKKGLEYIKRAERQGNLYARRQLSVLMIQGRLGLRWIPYGLVLFPYAALAALVDAALNGYSDKLIG